MEYMRQTIRDEVFDYFDIETPGEMSDHTLLHEHDTDDDHQSPKEEMVVGGS